MSGRWTGYALALEARERYRARRPLRQRHSKRLRRLSAILADRPMLRGAGR